MHDFGQVIFSKQSWDFVLPFGVPEGLLTALSALITNICNYWQDAQNENWPMFIPHLATPGCDLASSVQIIKLEEKTTTEKVKSKVVQTQLYHTPPHPHPPQPDAMQGH